jgi:3-oxoacyl-[acyl-carrier protein] reductase
LLKQGAAVAMGSWPSLFSIQPEVIPNLPWLVGKEVAVPAARRYPGGSSGERHAMRSVTETFQIDAAMVEAFAALSGDRNALHMDTAFARRSRYRERVAHGMLAVAHLARVQAAFPAATLVWRSLKGRFDAPMPLGSRLRLTIALHPADEAEGESFEAEWTMVQGGRRVLAVSGTLLCRPSAAAAAAGAAPAADDESCLLEEPIEELDRGPEALAAATATLPFRVTPAACAGLARLVGLEAGQPVCPNLAAALLLSTLVGMRLPGRRATFTSFAVTFVRDLALGEAAVLEGRVEKVSAASETLIGSVAIRAGGADIATGEIRAIVNPPPRPTLGAREIRDHHLGLGLAGKTVAVIGASRGIGATAAKLFAMHGATVIVHYFRGEADARAIVADIEDAGGEALPLGCDIRDEAAVAAFFTRIVEATGRLDVLVNNAVLDFSPTPLPELDWADLERELAVSLKGLHACCRAALPHLKEAGGGRIINVSSIATSQPVKGQGKYITAKSAVEGYTKSLAIELARDNIQVNLVVPAMTETDLLASIPSDFIRRAGSARAMKRNLQPIEVAQAMVYLASDWARGMSGQQVVLNLGEPPFA